MFTSFESHLPAVAETGRAGASPMARGVTQADADMAALARRIAP